MIADLRDYADGQLLPIEIVKAESVAFQMGLVFEVEVQRMEKSPTGWMGLASYRRSGFAENQMP